MVTWNTFQKKIFISFINGKRFSIRKTRYRKDEFKSKGVSLIRKIFLIRLKS